MWMQEDIKIENCSQGPFAHTKIIVALQGTILLRNFMYLNSNKKKLALFSIKIIPEIDQ